MQNSPTCQSSFWGPASRLNQPVNENTVRAYSFNLLNHELTMLPTPRAGPVRLLDQVRERMRYLHYSLRTEVAYVHWIRRFVLWSGKRHPRGHFLNPLQTA